MPPKSIWRSADAQHFTLVHRSQRDPLINDPDAPTRVLAATQRRQGNKGQPVSRKELEEEFKDKERKNVGEAAQYGVYFDDTTYDYMQHLRPIGGTYNAQRGGKDEEVDMDVVMLPGPTGSAQDKAKAKAGGQLTFKNDAEPTEAGLSLPREVLASKEEMDRDWAQGTEEQGGLRLDMDPHLRQALEALDDEAFLVGRAKQRKLEQAKHAARASADVDPAWKETLELDTPDEVSFDSGDAADGDFDDESEFDDLFATVIKSGEYDPAQADAEEWRRLPPGGDEALYLTSADKAQQRLQEVGGDNSSLSLTERVALFKQGLAPGAGAEVAQVEPSGQPAISAPSRRAPSSLGGSSIFGDAPGKKSKPGSKARHAMSFYAPSAGGGSTAWSMSSSAMERNAGLKGLDDSFDRLEQIYEQEDDDEADEDDEEGGFVREDFESILDEFLEKHEVIAGKLKQRLGGPNTSAVEKLDILRKEIGEAKVDQWMNAREETQAEIDKDIEARIRIVGIKKNEWDVETIQTTKTNMSNHPRLLSTRGTSVASGSSFRPATLGASTSRNRSDSSLNGSSEDFESIPKLRIDKRTGVSEVIGWTKQRKAARTDDDTSNLPDLSDLSIDDSSSGRDDDGSGPPPSYHARSSRSDGSGELEGDSGDDTETEESVRHTIKRDRNESKEEKRDRKEAAKQQKQDRKKEKAERKAEFANERKRQVKMDAGRLKDGGAADVRVGAGKRLG